MSLDGVLIGVLPSTKLIDRLGGVVDVHSEVATDFERCEFVTEGGWGASINALVSHQIKIFLIVFASYAL